MNNSVQDVHVRLSYDIIYELHVDVCTKALSNVRYEILHVLVLCLHAEPPSAPRNMALRSLSDGSQMLVTWSAPTETGGRSDLYYVVEYRDPDNLGQFIGTTCKSSTSHTFTGLRAFTQYCFQVSAHNGVSDQDPDNAALRTEEECIATPEASKICWTCEEVE